MCACTHVHTDGVPYIVVFIHTGGVVVFHTSWYSYTVMVSWCSIHTGGVVVFHTHWWCRGVPYTLVVSWCSMHTGGVPYTLVVSWCSIHTGGVVVFHGIMVFMHTDGAMVYYTTHMHLAHSVSRLSLSKLPIYRRSISTH